MPTSYEVAASFTVIDRASSVLTRISDLFSKIDAQTAKVREQLASIGAIRFTGATEGLAGVNEQLALIKMAGGEAAAGMRSTFSSVDTGAASAIPSLKAMKAEMASIGAASRAIAAAGVPRVGGGGGHGAIPGVTGPSVAIPGGFHAHLGRSNAALASLGLLGYGAYEEGEIESTAQKLFTTANILPKGALRDDPLFRAFRQAITSAMATTGAPLRELDAASLKAMQQLAGMPFGQRLDLLPDLLQGAAAEARQKGTTVTEGIEAIIGLAHMRRQYGPEQLRHIMRDFTYLSSIDPLNLAAMTKAAGYAIPTLVGGGYDPDAVMLAMTAMQRGGILSTKAGTWLRELGIRALPGTSLMSKRLFEAHEKGLHAFGLVDAHGQPTFLGDNGAPDFFKLIDTAARAYQGMTPAQRLVSERQVFGAQGSGALSFLGDPIVEKILGQTRQEMANFPAIRDYWARAQANAPDVQFRSTWGALQSVLIDLGAVILPPVVAGLKQLDAALHAIKAVTDTFPTISGKAQAVSTDVGLAVGARWGLGRLASLVGLGGAGAAGAGGLGMLGRLGLWGAAAAGGYELWTHRNAIYDLLFGGGSSPASAGPQVIVPRKYAGGGVRIQDWQTPPYPGLLQDYWNASRASKALRGAGYTGLNDPELGREQGLMVTRAQGLSKPINIAPVINQSNSDHSPGRRRLCRSADMAAH